MAQAFTYAFRTFAGGEIAPALMGRNDQDKYQNGLALCRNWFTRREGSASNRSGQLFVCPMRGFISDYAREIPFVFNNGQAYALLFTDQRISFVRNGAPIMETAKVITGITSANPPVVTSVAHGYSDGDMVYIDDVVGMEQVNGRFFSVDTLTADTFALKEEANVDGSGYTAYSSGGTSQRLYSITSPYAGADLSLIRYKQSADVMILVHTDYSPQKLSRISETNWTIEDVSFVPDIAAPTGGSGTGTGGGETVRYKVTAVAEDTQEESFAGTGTPFTVTNVAETIPDATKAITGATSANPVVVTSVAHGYANGDIVLLSSLGGMIELNDRYFIVSASAANTFALTDENGISVDGTAYGAYTAGGTVSRSYRYLVTTGAAHGLTTGDEVVLSGLVAYSILNNLTIRVTVASGTTFYSDKHYGDSTTSAAETGTGGKAFISVPSITFPTSLNPITVTWSAVSGAVEYNIYRETNGIYGYIGTAATVSFEDLGYVSDTTDTPPVNFELFSLSGYPGAIGFFQQRLVLGGFVDDPERVRASRIGLFYNFTRSQPTQADDSVSFITNSGQVNQVKHFEELERLIVFTQGNVITVEGDDAGTLTPTAINARIRSGNGIADVPPLVTGTTILFCEYQANVINEIIPNQPGQAFQSRDITVFAPHLFEGHEIVDWTWASKPYGIVWAVRDDGVMLGLTYLREQEVWGWHHHDTGDGDEYVGACALPETGESALYTLVRRYGVSGNTRIYCERSTSRQIDYSADGRFLDSFREQEGENETGGNTYQLNYDTTYSDDGSWWLAPTGGTALFTTGDLSPDIGRVILIYGPEGERIWCTILSINATDSALVSAVGDKPEWFNLDEQGSPNDGLDDDGNDDETEPFPLTLPYETSTWSQSVATVTDLWHLEGRTVTGLGDGIPLGNMVVENGTVTLPAPAVIVAIGLSIVADLQTLEPDTVQQETWVDKSKRMGQVSVKVERTLGLSVGLDKRTLQDFDPEWCRIDTYHDRELHTGMLTVLNKTRIDDSAQVFLRQRLPLPATVLGIFPVIEVGVS